MLVLVFLGELLVWVLQRVWVRMGAGEVWILVSWVWVRERRLGCGILGLVWQRRWMQRRLAGFFLEEIGWEREGDEKRRKRRRCCGLGPA